MAISWEELGTTVGINVGVAIAVFFIFNYLRRVPMVADYYAAKRKLSLPFRFRPPRLPPTTFTWMIPVFTMPDEKFAACAGYDALTYVNFLKLCLRITFWVTIIMGVMVLPTNWAAGTFVGDQLSIQEEVLEALRLEIGPTASISDCDDDIQGGDVDDELATSAAPAATKPQACNQLDAQIGVVTNFDRTSMSNIDPDKDEAKYLWVHLTALWLITLLMMKLLWTHWEEALKWRIVYLAQTRKDDAAHTVLVTDIPGTPQGTPIGRVYDNIDGTIGFLLPNSFKAKIKQAMEQGIGKVFGAITDNKLADKLGDKLGGRNDLFKDRNHNVYRRPGDRALAAAAASAAGGPYRQSVRSSVDDFADPEAGFYDAASQNGSFMSAVEGSVYETPRNSMRQGSMGSMSLPGMVRDEVEDPYPEDETTSSRPPIAGRRNLRNWHFEKPRTDFEVWEQAENALQNGVTVQELVRREFTSDFGSASVRCVTVLKNEITLSKLKKQYQQAKLKLEDLTDSWISLLRRKKTIKRKEITVKPNKKDLSHTKKWGTEKTKVDEMEYRRWLVQDSLNKLKEEQDIAKGEETSAAFVTMTKRLDQTSVATGMLSFREDLWIVDKAPEPTEVLWQNVAYRAWERGLRSLLSWGIFITLIIFMLPIIAFITQLVNLNVYAEKPGASGEWARWILALPVISQVLPGILPTLGLKIFLAVIPMFLTMSAVMVAGLHSESAVDFDVGRKFFLFQFVVVFLFITIIQAMSSSGTGDSALPIIDLVEQLIADPAQIPEWLGTSIPQVVPTYLQYILVNGVLAKGIAFLRLPGAAIFYILSKLSGTKRQKKKLWSQQYMQYGPELADHTITMLLVCVFAVMQPFIPLIALVYFICNFFYARYDLLYSKREAFQSGGLFWPVIFDQIYLGMMVMLIGYFALFGIKKFALGTALTVPLIILLILYKGAIAKTFKRPMEVLSLHAAADLDRADKKPSWQTTITPEEEKAMADAEWDLEEVKFGPVEERYMQPSLIVDEYAHSKTLDDAIDVSERVDAFNAGGDAAVGNFMLDDDMSDVSDHTDIGRGSVSKAGPMLMAGSVPMSMTHGKA